MRPMRSFFFCESAYEYALVYGYMAWLAVSVKAILAPPCIFH